MDRRKSIKTIIAGGMATAVLADACSTADKKQIAPEIKAAANKSSLNRMPEEREADKRIAAETFFTAEEMATITLLGDIIIPRDGISGSASDAKVPRFIEFIVKDMPQHQVPMRGGLRWLDVQCLNRYGKAFKDINGEQQTEMVEEIAWPAKAKPQMAPGVAFFNLMRNLTASGFYSSEIGVKDIGYMGNVPNQWNGVPDDVLRQYKLAYTERELRECVTYS